MLTPAEITEKTSEIWYKKANWVFSKTFFSGILGWMYIALWGFFSITSISWLAGVVPFWLIKVMAWLAFSLGLILVMIAWADLFTGNTMLFVARLNKKISWLQYIKNLFIIYLSNFVWALIVVSLLYVAWRHLNGDWIVAQTLFNIGTHKLTYWFWQAVSLGTLCNILVCLGVWLAYSGKTTTDKVMGIIFPITAFVAWWFEHSVANMFYLPFTYLLNITGAAGITQSSSVTLHNIFVHNMLPVTIGNIIGWAIFVGGIYWCIYQKK